MLKRILDQNTQNSSLSIQHWLDAEALAQVEVTSEDPAYPIESGLLPRSGPGWRAAQPGPQIVRLVFDSPQLIKRLHLEFDETELNRTQQFVLRWSSDRGNSYQEIVRQQYNFNPSGATRECEDYSVNLVDVTTLELAIIPDISGGPARASLSQLRFA
ncbi:MAG TPA: hypothetical protein VFM05_09595 [Candidatus Saccharimonadales bacterium]|nr:hypothetical protein [Candidatus Saccharimonadales bacterium]